ncbi:MAG: twin-arginine translocation signal domain-containing protein, partial [Acidobacteriota bacterium]|nr:twin-arginine translocation signal domain-containing protein [Acidobacteriota bacterium]
MNRRNFVQTAAATALAAAAPAQTPKKMIGIQVGAVSFVDEGVNQVLDIFQQSAYVNTLFVATFTYGRGIAGRQVPGQPLPDHGKQQYDTGTFHGGAYTRIDPRFFQNTAIRDFRAPDFGDYDVLDAVLPEAKKRAMKTICWFEDVWSPAVPNIAQAQERRFDGSNATTLCFNNPNYRNWLLGMVENYARSYDIDGIMWGSERQGAFANSLGASHGGNPNVAHATCFCPPCEAKAKTRGIDPARARAGFAALDTFVQAARQKKRPVDGYYVTLWRLILRYPELLAWEMLWTDSLRETYAAMHRTLKSVKPAAGIGWHIWHNNSFSPIYRAEQDLSELSPYSDFLKMVMYHNCAGERMASYIRGAGSTIFGDVPPQELLDFHYRVLDYAHEKPLADLPRTGFSADY